MEKYIKLKDVYYSFNNVGKIVLLKKDEKGDYTIREEAKNGYMRRASEVFKDYSLLYIHPYLETVDFDFDKSVRVDVKLEITIAKLEDDTL